MSASSCCSGLSVVVGAPVVLVTTVVDDAGAVVDGGAGSDAAPASRPHAANVSSAHPADRDARDTTHRSFLLLLRLLTRRFGGPEEGVPEHDRIGNAGWPPGPPGAIERPRKATDGPVGGRPRRSRRRRADPETVMNADGLGASTGGGGPPASRVSG